MILFQVEIVTFTPTEVVIQEPGFHICYIFKVLSILGHPQNGILYVTNLARVEINLKNGSRPKRMRNRGLYDPAAVSQQYDS